MSGSFSAFMLARLDEGWIDFCPQNAVYPSWSEEVWIRQVEAFHLAPSIILTLFLRQGGCQNA